MDDFAQYRTLTQFSRTLFAKPALRPILQRLQSKADYNLNIIFYLLWIAKASQGRLTKQHFSALESHISLWHQRVILELKYTHSLLAKHTDPTAMEIKHTIQDEILRANDIEQCLLCETDVKTHILQRTPEEQLSDACSSMVSYCEAQGSKVFVRHHPALVSLFSAVFDSVDKQAVVKALTLPDRSTLG